MIALKNIFHFYKPSRLRLKIWRLALPVIFSMVTHSGVMVTDTLMVAQLGQSALAVTGIGGMLIWTIISFFVGASVGVQIIIAKRYGERNYGAASNVLIISLWISACTGIIISLILYILAPFLLPFIANSRDFSQATISFVEFRSIGLTLYFTMYVIRAFFDGIGKTHIGLSSSFVTMCANIFFNWLLIYGNLGFDAYGTDGAAIASSLAAIPGLLVGFAFFFYKKYRIFLHYTPLPTLATMHQVITIGFVAGLDNFLLYFSFILFYKLAAIIGTTSVAVTNILMSFLSISFMPGIGFATATTTLVGQAVAEKKYRQAYCSVRRTGAYSARTMGSLGIIFMVLGLPILEFLTNGNTPVIEEAYPALLVLGLTQVADAYQMNLGAAIRSAGLVTWVMAMYALSSFFIMLPVSYILGILAGLKSLGLWLGVSIWGLFLWLAFAYKFSNQNLQRENSVSRTE